MTAISRRRLAALAALAGAGTLAGCARTNPLDAPSPAATTPGTMSGPGTPDAKVTLVVGSQQYYSNEIIAELYAQALENAGYDVASFDNGLSAYNRLREEPFELLLTDIVMPEMDGIELARRATELDPDIKVMFITGFAAVALNPDNQAPRQAKILSKPFHLRDLVNEVERMVAAA